MITPTLTFFRPSIGLPPAEPAFDAGASEAAEGGARLAMDAPGE